MRTDFRQGIISYSNDLNQQTFLSVQGNYVSLLTTHGDTYITFANGSENYLYIENLPVTNAWGPLVDNVDYWIYWELNPLTAIRTFGFTDVSPIIGSVIPANPIQDQHWFDTANQRMKVFQYGEWHNVLRVFAAKINTTVITPLGDSMEFPFAGSQVGIQSINTRSGRLITDNTGTTIRYKSGKLVTTEDDLYVHSSPAITIQPEAQYLEGIATQDISSYKVVKYSQFGYFELATYNDINTTTIAIVTETLVTNQAGTTCIQGVISNPSWQFQIVGAPLWIAGDGTLTDVYPRSLDPYTYPEDKAPIARVLTANSVYFDPNMGGKGVKGDSLSNVVPATPLIYGVARLSVPPLDVSNPIAVGNNDPRLIPYTHPATHPSTMVTTTPYKFLTGLTAYDQLRQLVDRPLNSLTDVFAVTPSANEYLRWNGFQWSDAIITPIQYLQTLLDVQLVSPVLGNSLTFDGTNWINANRSTTTLTGDVLGSGVDTIPTTLATVNNNVGTFGSATSVAAFTVNAKGLITAAHDIPIVVSGPTTGTVFSVDGSGGTTGLTWTGGPITTTGTLTLGGTLNVANGGTSATTANAAFNNLAPSQVNQAGEFLTTDGSNTSWSPILEIKTNVWGWGLDHVGQLGDGMLTSTSVSSPVQMGAGSYWKHVSMGYRHMLAIKNDGTLWSCGYNQFYGSLGLGDTVSRSFPTQVGTLTNWYQVFGGYETSYAIKNDGTLWSWGYNSSGQLGDGTTTRRSSPVQIGALTDWKKVVCGDGFAVALKTNGTVWAWGSNTAGQLGDGTIINRSSPIQVGALTNWKDIACAYSTTYAIKTDGTLWAWGINNGMLGDGTLTPNYSSPVQIGALTTWSSVGSGYFQVGAIKQDGSLWMWGHNRYGQLGNGQNGFGLKESSPIQVGSLTNWKQVAPGYYHTVAAKKDGTIWAWGYNSDGELAQGDGLHRSSPVQIGSLTNWSYVTVGGSFSAFGVQNTTQPVPIAAGGTGATTSEDALKSLLPQYTGPANMVLTTDGTDVRWALLSSL